MFTTGLQKREIFHFFFLENLLKISDPTLYILKGGVNLRFYFKSPRYSEDMDLDVLAGNVSTLKKNGYKILNSGTFQRVLQTFGIREIAINDPAKAKQTETTQRFRLKLITDAGDSLPTKVEFSRRSQKKESFLFEPIDTEVARTYQRLAFQCQHYDGSSAAAQKVRALAGREITQARDVFDLRLLQLGGYFDSNEVKARIEKSSIAKAADNLNTIDYAQYEGQVLEFLEESSRTSYEGNNYWKQLKEAISKVLSHAG